MTHQANTTITLTTGNDINTDAITRQDTVDTSNTTPPGTATATDSFGTCTACNNYRRITKTGGGTPRTCKNMSRFNCFQTSSIIAPAVKKTIAHAKDVIKTWPYPTNYKQAKPSTSQQAAMDLHGFKSYSGIGCKDVKKILMSLGKAPTNKSSPLICLLHDLANHEKLVSKIATVKLKNDDVVVDNQSTIATLYPCKRAVLAKWLDNKGAVSNIKTGTGGNVRGEAERRIMIERILLLQAGRDVPMKAPAATKKRKFTASETPVVPRQVLTNSTTATDSDISSTTSTSNTGKKYNMAKYMPAKRQKLSTATHALKRSMRSTGSKDGHGTVAAKVTLRHSAQVVGAATHFSATIVNGSSGKPGVDTPITVVLSEFVTEDEFKAALFGMLVKLKAGKVTFIKTAEALQQINIVEDAKIKKERRPEPEPTTGPDAS